MDITPVLAETTGYFTLDGLRPPSWAPMARAAMITTPCRLSAVPMTLGCRMWCPIWFTTITTLTSTTAAAATIAALTGASPENTVGRGTGLGRRVADLDRAEACRCR